uniref:Uncharacterized protein n=2 Tax=Anguilla anguilla TaxID=7936 RepID=A0A0E9TEE2_ANGAN
MGTAATVYSSCNLASSLILLNYFNQRKCI